MPTEDGADGDTKPQLFSALETQVGPGKNSMVGDVDDVRVWVKGVAPFGVVLEVRTKFRGVF